MRRFVLGSLSLATLGLAAFALGGCCVSPTLLDSGTSDGAMRPDSGLPDRPDSGVDAGPEDTGPLARIPTNGSAIGVTRDDKVAVVVNKNDGHPGGATVERYSIDKTLTPPTVVSGGALLVPGATQVIIGGDDDSAFVAGSNPTTTGGGLVLKLSMLKRSPMIVSTQQASTGSEPRGLALSPSGKLLYVANWADGTVSVFDTSDLTPRGVVDLNPALAASGVLGEQAVNLQRPGLAHPYAIAVTDNGDDNDDDETVFVTEYFSQARVAGIPGDDSAFDVGRQGVVYYFRVSDQLVSPLITITARSVADQALVDSNQATTGCFPNILVAATVHKNRLYVTGRCSSPRGPVGPVIDTNSGLSVDDQNFKTLVHSAVFVINTQTKLEEPLQGLILTHEFQTLYDQQGTSDDEHRRMPLLANDLAFIPDSDTALLTAFGADAVFRIDYNANGSLARVGSAARPFIDLAGGLPNGAKPGYLPLGLVTSSKKDFAFVINEHSRNISFIKLSDETVTGSGDLRDAETSGIEANINDGRRFFVTGLGRWSYRGQAWSSCESCHPGGLTDGVTWFLPTGPRQTIGLDGSFGQGANPNQRIFGWRATADEVHDFEGFTRAISGGVGAIVHTVSPTAPPVEADRIHFEDTSPTPAGQVPTGSPQDWLNGSTAGMMPGGAVTPHSRIEDWNKIFAYVQQLRSPQAPSTLVPADVTAGSLLYVEHNCAGCHGTELWTISRLFYTPSEALNNPLMGTLTSSTYRAPPTFPAELNPASSMGNRRAHYRIYDPLDDPIYCALRDVGTFPDIPDAQRHGVAPMGVLVKEVRDDMTTLASGSGGFNPPSLLGLSASAPFFHAGNARTLEEVFSDEFVRHHTAYSPSFPGTGDRAILIGQLVSFLLSIDDRTMPMSPPIAALGFAATICPEHL